MKERMSQMAKAGAEKVFWSNRERRYAGDETLARGSYYSVCRNAGGDDIGTVTKEMNAYRQPDRSGFVVAMDLYYDECRDFLHDSGAARHAFAVYIKDGSRFREVSGLRDEDIAIIPPGPVCVEVPYQVAYREIDRVFDLRQPRAQKWFFERFRLGDGETLRKPEGNDATSFLDMLPTLMSGELGGNGVTNAIGMWMRANKVNGLVFPSARANAGVTIENGKLVDWWGWNLVDYREAGEPYLDAWADLSPWKLKVPKGVTVRFSDRGKFAGSWQYMGNEEAQDERYGIALKLSAPGGNSN